MRKTLSVSVIVPVHNESNNIPILHAQLITILKHLNKSFELIYINDGSSDNTQQLLKRFASFHKKVKIIEFRRNFGQTSAISAGIDYAHGKVLVFADADLQNDPKDIPKLLEKISEGFDVVSGWRKYRRDNFFTKVVPSLIANKLLAEILKVSIHDFGCTLKAYRREFLIQSRLYGEMHRFLPYVAANQGGKITEIVVNHRPRQYGRSHYSLNRIFKVIVDMIMLKLFYDYSSKPAYVFGLGGIAMFGISVLLAIYTLWEKIVWGIYVHRNPIFLLSMFTLTSSIQFILLGFVTEFIMRTYFETLNKPTYQIKNKINF